MDLKYGADFYEEKLKVYKDTINRAELMLKKYKQIFFLELNQNQVDFVNFKIDELTTIIATMKSNSEKCTILFKDATKLEQLLGFALDTTL